MEADDFSDIRKLCLFCDVPKIENDQNSPDDDSKQLEDEVYSKCCINSSKAFVKF